MVSDQKPLTGGIEVIDPRTLTSQGLLVDDDDAGGNISSLALARAGAVVIGYCIVTLPSGANVVRRFDAATGALDPMPVYQSASFLPALISDEEGFILVAEHSIADPKLTIVDPWLKIFTALYVLVGIGILVEVARRLGRGFIAGREQIREDQARKAAQGDGA